MIQVAVFEDLKSRRLVKFLTDNIFSVVYVCVWLLALSYKCARVVGEIALVDYRSHHFYRICGSISIVCLRVWISSYTIKKF